MAMPTIYFAGNTQAGFVSEATAQDATRVVDTVFPPAAVVLTSGMLHYAPLNTAITQGWAHFAFYETSTASSNYDDNAFAIFKDASDVNVFGVGCTNSVIHIRVWNGSGWDFVADSGRSLRNDKASAFDVQFLLDGTTGFIKVWRDKVLICEFSGNTLRGTATDIQRVNFGPANNNSATYAHCRLSEVLVSDSPTFMSRVFSATLDAAGTTNTMASGTYADIDEEVLFNDADFVSSDTAGQIITASCQNGPSTQLVPHAVCVSYRALRGDAVGPQTMNAVLRSGTTDYHGSNRPLDLTFGPHYEVWGADPDTAADWTPAGIDAMEIGVRSAA